MGEPETITPERVPGDTAAERKGKTPIERFHDRVESLSGDQKSADGMVVNLSDNIKQVAKQLLMDGTFDNSCSMIRGMLREIGEEVLALRKHHDLLRTPYATKPGEPDKGEMIANLMLSYRHVEDAIMRLGKAIQAYDGGKSVYTK